MAKRSNEVSVKRKSLARDIPGGKVYVTGSEVKSVRIGQGEKLRNKAAVLSGADRPKRKFHRDA